MAARPTSAAPEETIDAALASFHPIIRAWFAERLGEPSPPQRQGWPLIRNHQSVLVAAPTGSGKTLAAFLACLDELFKDALEGKLKDETRLLYVSPLKALGNDVQQNLLRPLEEIYERARAQGLDPQPIRVQVRSGDTRPSERAGMVKRPPHILITTPESFYLYLTARQSRETLRQVKTVIVDEIHALARDKRGSHFSLSMERLKALLSASPQLIGLSATQKPLPEIAAFLTGASPNGTPPCTIVSVGHMRPWQISVETPDQELSSVASHEMWGQIYDRLTELSAEHRTILLFTNTRRLAERVAHDLGERIGKDKVAAHHGSMAREMRLSAEKRLKEGSLRVMVATASLELGIDIGSIDLVCLVGSPRAISVCLQRIGRAGHHKAAVSKGMLFAMTRDELVECTALVRAIREGELDAVRIPQKGLDVLAQQIVAACACEEWEERKLFELFKGAYPYRDLEWREFEQVLRMLSEPVATGRGRTRVHLHRDRVNGKLHARPGARITALTNAGAIPDTFTYPVIAEPEEKLVGTLDEDFAVESMAGDVFLLGSTAWRFQRIYGGTVRVENAQGQAPTVPFWRGEAPARTEELSGEVSRLREDLASRPDALDFLEKELGLSASTAELLVRYVRAGAAVLGAVPSVSTVVAERFFDEAGGMQLIIHAPFGARINRAWGLALRKSFCRAFDFELQAAASDDGILLSLSEQHSFPLADVFEFLSPQNVEDVLIQATLQAPMFGTRFRWNANRSLALNRFSMGKRVPPQIQRARSDDLMAAVFPAQTACQDNAVTAYVDVPDHPLVAETIRDCLHEAMDIDGLKRVLEGIRAGRIRTLAVDLPEPSVFAHQLLNSQPYTYLDDAPLEERRARAVSVRRSLPPEDAAAFGALDEQAIAQVRLDAQPLIRNKEELHDALLQLVLASDDEAKPSAALDDSASEAPAENLVELLIGEGRAARLEVHGRTFVVAAERVAHAEAIFPDAPLVPKLALLPGDTPLARDVAVAALVRGRMEICGPITVLELSSMLGVPESEVREALGHLESQGQVLRGRFRPASLLGANGAQADRSTNDGVEWCDRRLLQRIHRLTVGRLRQEIQPLSPQDFMRFLFRWHHLEAGDTLRGKGGLVKAISLLQGYEAPAAAWEQVLLPARMRPYLPELLERACWNGEIAWGRLTRREPRAVPGPRRGASNGGPVLAPAPEAPSARPALPGRNANITFLRREELDWLLSAAVPGEATELVSIPEDLSHPARSVAEALQRRGASFFAELVAATRRLPAEVEDALWELLARGLVTADAVENLRTLQSPKRRKRQKALRRGGPGRWTLLATSQARGAAEVHEHLARVFLQRYGIVWRDLVMREALAPTWRELLYVYRRMEARGEIRGGRFVSGFAGEQFALSEAVDIARAVRRAPSSGQVIQLSAVDPLNLTGFVTPGPRAPSVLGHVVTFVDGVPQASDAVNGAEAVEPLGTRHDAPNGPRQAVSAR